MKPKHSLLLLFLGSIATHTYAMDNTTPDAAAVETYTYATRLDITRVISITEPANTCAPVPVQMTYEDSKGKRHILAYQMMGTGCTN